MKKTYFNPSCALSIYKPDMESRLLDYLNKNYRETALHKVCCHHDPRLEIDSLIINVCGGCDKRFDSLYDGVSTISLWEVIDSIDSFSFPNYGGFKISVQDACPVREKPQVHQAVRNLLRKMNIEVVETEFHGTRSICCGDGFYQSLPIDQVHQKMTERAQSMPCEDVCAYCISCIKAIYVGGKKPRYLLDLLMGEDTDAQTSDTVKWHEQLATYIEQH